TTTADVSAATLITANFTATAPAQMIVSEFNYHSAPGLDAGDWIEIKNSGIDAVDLGGWYVSDEDDLHRFTFPVGYLLPPNEYRLLVEDTTKFFQQHPAVNVVAGQMSFGLNAGGDKVRLFNNLDSAVADITYADSLPWPPGADGHGRTLELKEAAADFNDPSSWFDGCIGGSPGAAYTSCNGAVIISEINYNSNPFYPSDDWLELRNISNEVIDISNWQFQDDNDSNIFVLPSPTLLEPHTNLVLSSSLDDFHAVFPSVNNAIGDFGFNLSGSGEWLRFYDAQDELVISIDYRDTLPFPVTADGQGYTLEVLDSSGKMNEGSNWFAGCLKGSPGNYFFTPCEVATASSPPASSNTVFFIYPNPANDEVMFEFPSFPSAFHLRIYNSSGIPVASFALDKNRTSFQLNTSEYPNGIYQCTIQSDYILLHQKFTVIH
ncbi:MAG TPA: lamin tail domain-containing protein, partial [Chitinophagales bacterium]|nr:lamin tail domain-containing protein [Chitinophagales bacterium]